jgi:tRNA-dihydrouridine synthase
METHETEVPSIPQIFGGDPGDMATAAEMLAPAADVIDLNFGCPAPKVTNICAGAALMGEPDRLVGMVETIVDRVDVPVTAKMRLGTGGAMLNNSTEICQRLEQVGAQRLCIHGRTLKQRYSGEADWTSIKEAVEAVDVPVVANGDGLDAASAAAWRHRATNRFLRHQGRFGVDEAPGFTLGSHERCLARFDGDWAGVCFTQMVLGPLHRTVRGNGWHSG